MSDVQKGRCRGKVFAHRSEPLLHPHIRKFGPARLRPHRAVLLSLKRTLARAGVEDDLDRAGPYLYTEQPDGRIVEAILDAVVITQGCFTSTPLDVTIRCLRSFRTRGSHADAAWQPATAARDGETEKLSRYGPSVAPMALETYGRMGYS